MTRFERIFGRREEDDDGKVFGDAVKAMLDVGGDKDQGASLNRGIFFADANLPFAAHDIVQFILGMRLLRVGGAGGEFIESGAHGGNAQEFVIELAGLLAGGAQV